jgi:hypothetical protein
VPPRIDPMKRGYNLMGEMRKKIPAGRERELQVYFRDTRLTSGSVACVVTSKRDCTWHHLNHRNSDERLSNIVPLLQNLNKNLDIARKTVEYLDPLLECDHLERIAQNAFWLDGQAARAFGCTRIGYYVAQYKGYSFSEQLKWAGQALYYARHKPNYQIIEQLLLDTIIRPLTQDTESIQEEVIRSLLQEFETLLTLGNDTKAAASISEYSHHAYPPHNAVKYAGAVRRRAHTLGSAFGPTKEVLNLLKESAEVVPWNDNQALNVVSTRNQLHLGEGTTEGYRKALETASDAFERFVRPKIKVHNARVWSKSKAAELPVHASPANVAHLSLSLCVGLAVSKPNRWKDLLQEALVVAEHYWALAGSRIDGPGRGSWRQVISSLNSTDPLHAQLIRLIDREVAPPFPSTLKKKIYKAAESLVGRLR